MKQEQAISNADMRLNTADMLVMTLAPAAVSIYYYGLRAALLILISAASAVICQRIGFALMKKERDKGDFAALFCGIIIALLLPVSVPLWMPAVGSIFAVATAMLPFGSSTRSPFVPAAAGLAFVIICWPEVAFSYPLPGAEILVGSNSEFIASPSVAGMLKNGNSLNPDWFNFMDILVGRLPGPMGTTSMLVTAGIAVYMLIRHPSRFISSASFVAMCGVFAVILPRVMSGRKMSLIMELSSGMLLFAAIFFMTYPSTQPKGAISRLLYGMAAGSLCMLLRYVGPYEDGSVFAVLLMNGIWPAADRQLELMLEKRRLKKASAPEKRPSKRKGAEG